jgi:alkanesulfonate monooxygenase SsuD/methylene tetrahydromethanopterin reductase-like flavin-dependent oxidoreductase (luciferase family)
MRIGIALDYSGGFHEAVDRVVELEKAGIEVAVVTEAYAFDAVSQLGHLAAKTNTVELASGVWGEALAAGAAKRDPALGPLDVMVHASLAIGDNVEDRLAWSKPQLALYLGGMGAKGRNFYHNLATRYGYGEVADRIQELYLSGRKREATALVPDELVRGMSLVGPRGYVAERLAAFAEAGVTTLLVNPLGADPGEAMRFVEDVLRMRPA